MKAIVLKRFKDKHTGEVYKEGAVITLTKKRFNEILETALLVEEIKEDTAKDAE